jgi:hypothetical protein
MRLTRVHRARHGFLSLSVQSSRVAGQRALRQVSGRRMATISIAAASCLALRRARRKMAWKIRRRGRQAA